MLVVALTPTEYRLLRFLMVNAGRVVSKAEILDHVWGHDPDRDGNAVEPVLSYLRRKVDQGRAEADPHGPRLRLRAADPAPVRTGRGRPAGLRCAPG